MLGSSRVAAQLAASQEGLSSMSENECVSLKVTRNRTRHFRHSYHPKGDNINKFRYKCSTFVVYDSHDTCIRNNLCSEYSSYNLKVFYSGPISAVASSHNTKFIPCINHARLFPLLSPFLLGSHILCIQNVPWYFSLLMIAVWAGSSRRLQ
jgi:hypothetical protein